MSDLVVETRGLRKVYRDAGRKVVAVDSLDLAVERGGVHGFLGPNGSGKTTTIRLLLGLASPDEGSITVLGQSYPEQVPAALTRVGALLERGLFSPGLSGRRNLDLLARAAGLPKSRVGEVIEQVDLGEVAKRRYRGYSLGVRRRLSLAAALLKKPELLILDEPSNGLDPAGIRDVRDTIPRLAESGVNVLLSSHILAEVQEVCGSVSIIDAGRLVGSGKVADLLGESTARTRVGVAEPDRADSVLSGAGYQVQREGDFLVVEGHEHPEMITRLLADSGLYVSELHAIRPTLESYFLKLTGHRPTSPEDPQARAADQTAEHLRDLEDGADS
ncbi:ABC transporter ATP-binding protein [Nocardioides marmorisolisilvae]|uniref:ABC transporter ATP-binding protein n=1 Tax=Nocardioides marmorisolisilvae TaxID=1542737 RepID=A0A3N0DTU2_9ACTN|nr:ABC transporter ATP-binding protein [Nocardioides marmorisolisilvae]RNL79030.1 ABC transporter ATP-binding protein [Nocardioides marmorisolisilvae]